MMVQIASSNARIKKIARRLRAAAACRQELTDGEITQFIVTVGVDRTWRVFDKTTAPRAAARAD